MGKRPDAIADSLSIEPIPPKEIVPTGEVVPVQPAPPAGEPSEDELEKDYEFARNNMVELIKKGMSSLDELIQIAGQDEKARSFEVVGMMMKQIADVNRDLINVSGKKNEKAKGKNGPVEKITNNNLFVGSTAELQKVLKEMKDRG